MKRTANYGLRKPDGNDAVNIEDLNYNADILDKKVKEVESNAGSVKSVNGKTGAVVLNAADIKTSSGTTVESQLAETAKKIDVVFQYGNNVKARTVDALLQADKSLQIKKEDSWDNIINSINETDKNGICIDTVQIAIRSVNDKYIYDLNYILNWKNETICILRDSSANYVADKILYVDSYFIFLHYKEKIINCFYNENGDKTTNPHNPAKKKWTIQLKNDFTENNIKIVDNKLYISKERCIEHYDIPSGKIIKSLSFKDYIRDFSITCKGIYILTFDKNLVVKYYDINGNFINKIDCQCECDKIFIDDLDNDKIYVYNQNNLLIYENMTLKLKINDYILCLGRQQKNNKSTIIYFSSVRQKQHSAGTENIYYHKIVKVRNNNVTDIILPPTDIIIDSIGDSYICGHKHYNSYDDVQYLIRLI